MVNLVISLRHPRKGVASYSSDFSQIVIYLPSLALHRDDLTDDEVCAIAMNRYFLIEFTCIICKIHGFSCKRLQSAGLSINCFPGWFADVAEFHLDQYFN